jgi:hypothetical protein
MGHSEVAVRWLAISICISIGSVVNDGGCHLTAMIASVDGSMVSQRAGEAQQGDLR